MRRTLFIGCLIFGLIGPASATEMQGVIVDWNCVKSMVRNGRENTLKNNRSCSMMKNYNRATYGLMTDDKKFFRLQDPGNAKILQLLKDTPDKDNLHVVVTGEIQNENMTVVNISEL